MKILGMGMQSNLFEKWILIDQTREIKNLCKKLL